MFTHKDIETRSFFVINCLEHEKSMRVSNGELLLEEINKDEKKVLTKFPFQKILALFVIGHFTVTTPLIDKCRKYNVALIVVKPNLRPVFYWAESSEGNYLLRRRQYAYSDEDLSVAKVIVANKISNQLQCLKRTRKKDDLTQKALIQCNAALDTIDDITNYYELMGLEGMVSKVYFAAYYQNFDWKGRRPRVKNDVLNLTLDIGYTILFNYLECFVRMFGFDLYVGVYHRLWFKRKSLICDLIEPFRCLIDHAVLLAFNRKQFKKEDFERIKSEFRLKKGMSATYYRGLL